MKTILKKFCLFLFFQRECDFLMKNNLKIFHFDEINSTNSYLYDKLAVGEDVSDVVAVAEHQTAGRGMGKNHWESERGKNLLFSIALNVNYLKAEDQFKISQAVSVAIVDALQEVICKPGLMIKWPNDIYFHDKKLCGMLIQNTIDGRMMGITIVGIGLNINQLQFGDDLPNPISLKNITGEEYNIDGILNQLIVKIVDNVENLKSKEFFEVLNKKYTEKLYRYRQWADYYYKNKVKSMIIKGFDCFGRLLLEDKSGEEIVCDVKELQFFPPSCPPDSEADV